MTTISTETIRASLRNPEGKDSFRQTFCAYIAARLPDEADPQTFHAAVDEILREMIDGNSSVPGIPVPPLVRDHAKYLGSFLLEESVVIARDHCPPDFALSVYAVHLQHYG